MLENFFLRSSSHTMVIQEEKMLDKSFNYSVPHSQPPLFHPGLYNLAQIINTVTLLPIPPPSPPKQKTAEVTTKILYQWQCLLVFINTFCLNILLSILIVKKTFLQFSLYNHYHVFFTFSIFVDIYRKNMNHKFYNLNPFLSLIWPQMKRISLMYSW